MKNGKQQSQEHSTGKTGCAQITITLRQRAFDAIRSSEYIDIDTGVSNNCSGHRCNEKHDNLNEYK